MFPLGAFDRGGAYLLKAQIAGGNTSEIVYWVNEALIVKKKLKRADYYFLADAENGEPLPELNSSFSAIPRGIRNRLRQVQRTGWRSQRDPLSRKLMKRESLFSSLRSPMRN